MVLKKSRGISKWQKDNTSSAMALWHHVDLLCQPPRAVMPGDTTVAPAPQRFETSVHRQEVMSPSNEGSAGLLPESSSSSLVVSAAW